MPLSSFPRARMPVAGCSAHASRQSLWPCSLQVLARFPPGTGTLYGLGSRFSRWGLRAAGERTAPLPRLIQPWAQLVFSGSGPGRPPASAGTAPRRLPQPAQSFAYPCGTFASAAPAAYSRIPPGSPHPLPLAGSSISSAPVRPCTSGGRPPPGCPARLGAAFPWKTFVS